MIDPHAQQEMDTSEGPPDELGQCNMEAVSNRVAHQCIDDIYHDGMQGQSASSSSQDMAIGRNQCHASRGGGGRQRFLEVLGRGNPCLDWKCSILSFLANQIWPLMLDDYSIGEWPEY